MARIGIGLVAAALMTMACAHPAIAQTPDQFGQRIDPVANAEVDRARKLRMPFGKSPNDAKKDALRAVQILESLVAKKPDHYRAQFNLGLAWHEAGNYAKANEAFDAALKVRNDRSIQDISLLNSAGWVALQNGDYPTARTRLEQAVKDIDQGPQSSKASVYYNLGQVYFLTQRFDEAEKYLTIAKDQFGSKTAAETLKLINKTNTLFKSRQNLKK